MFKRGAAAHKLPEPTTDTVAELTHRALDLATQAAERATAAAHEARNSATPFVRTAALRSAETLSDAAAKAAVLLADTADRLADSAPNNSVRRAARHGVEASAAMVAAKVKRRKWPYALVGTALIAGAVVAYLSPLADELRDRLLLMDEDEEDDEDDAITLPPTQEHEEVVTAKPHRGATGEGSTDHHDHSHAKGHPEHQE